MTLWLIIEGLRSSGTPEGERMNAKAYGVNMRHQANSQKRIENFVQLRRVDSRHMHVARAIDPDAR